MGEDDDNNYILIEFSKEENGKADDHLHAAEAAEEIHDCDLAIYLQDVAAMPEEQQQQPIVEEVESDAFVPVTVVGAGTRRYSLCLNKKDS